MLKYTVTTQKKIEEIIRESGYILRFEKGNFKSGYCILESKKVVVINKFLPRESKISNMVDLLSRIEIIPDQLSENSRAFLEVLNQQEFAF